MPCSKLLKTILLPVLLLLSQLAFAQDRVITGKITDQSGLGISGVTVTPKGGGTPTQTSSDGTFKITVKSTTTSLIFSSIGFETQEVPASEHVSVSLKNANSSLNEVVV